MGEFPCVFYMKRYVCFPSHGNGIFIGDGVKTSPLTRNYEKGYTNREWNRPYVLEIEELDGCVSSE